ncbi:MAG: glycosyltransferase [Schumannella sp.]|nr:glycosyltransferase [Schumannella sp.]
MTWSIPDQYGGMTTALLQRSRAFVRLGGVPVDILTFDTRADYPEKEAALRERGELIDGMRLLNLYQWLRENPLPGGTLRLDRDTFTPLESDLAADGDLVRIRQADDGTVLQVDHLRADGTLVLTDRRDTRVRGTLGGRSVVLCDERGRPVRSWGRIHHLYAAWLDRLTDKQPSFMIVDSKTIASFMLTYRRAHVTRAHVVHNSHLGRGGLRESRREVFEQLDGFEIIVLLTQRQRSDVREMAGPVGHLTVIPNAARFDLPVAGERDPRRGVVLASLTARKRVDHAMQAAYDAAAILDVYGDGELRERLETLAEGLHGVQLHGHLPDARAQLGSASFVLSTGSSEGFPLVLVEALAAGCIPIAYDVPYGPSDLLDGVNGILVPSGNREALAEAIRTLMTEPEEQLDERRRAARRTAERYSDEAVTEAWARELHTAARRRQRVSVVQRVRAGARAVLRAS